MCTYITETLQIKGSGKGPEGNWLRVTDASVYFDHPVHALDDHTINVDLRSPADGPSARVALELNPTSARELAEAILQTLASGSETLGVDLSQPINRPDGQAE